MATCSLSTRGIDDVIKALEKMGKVADRAIDEALLEGAQPILDNMKSTDQFKDRTGKSRKDLAISKVKIKKGRRYVTIGDVKNKHPNLWYIENGTPRMVARPFMRTAYRQERDKALNLMADSLRKSFKKLGDG